MLSSALIFWLALAGSRPAPASSVFFSLKDVEEAKPDAREKPRKTPPRTPRARPSALDTQRDAKVPPAVKPIPGPARAPVAPSVPTAAPAATSPPEPEAATESTRPRSIANPEPQRTPDPPPAPKPKLPEPARRTEEPRVRPAEDQPAPRARDPEPPITTKQNQTEPKPRTEEPHHNKPRPTCTDEVKDARTMITEVLGEDLVGLKYGSDAPTGLGTIDFKLSEIDGEVQLVLTQSKDGQKARVIGVSPARICVVNEGSKRVIRVGTQSSKFQFKDGIFDITGAYVQSHLPAGELPFLLTPTGKSGQVLVRDGGNGDLKATFSVKSAR